MHGADLVELNCSAAPNQKIDSDVIYASAVLTSNLIQEFPFSLPSPSSLLKLPIINFLRAQSFANHDLTGISTVYLNCKYFVQKSMRVQSATFSSRGLRLFMLTTSSG